MPIDTSNITIDDTLPMQSQMSPGTEHSIFAFKVGTDGAPVKGSQGWYKISTLIDTLGQEATAAKDAALAAQTAAESAKDAAQSSASAAATSASTASSKASSASKAASAAATSASNASSSASQAASSKTAAESAKTAAETAKTQAKSSASAASSSASSASKSASAAQTAKTEAESAKTAAQSAQAAAEAAKEACEQLAEDFNIDSLTTTINNKLGKTEIQGNAYRRLPAGTVIWFAGLTAKKPAGTLICDGSLVSRTQYADLFAAIGTKYGAGNGSTTFALPNLMDGGDSGNLGRFIRAATSDGEVGVKQSDAIRDITGSLNFHGNRNGAGATTLQSVTGAFIGYTQQSNYLELQQFANAAATSYCTATLMASAVVNTDTENRPYGLCLLPLVAY